MKSERKMRWDESVYRTRTNMCTLINHHLPFCQYIPLEQSYEILIFPSFSRRGLCNSVRFVSNLWYLLFLQFFSITFFPTKDDDEDTESSPEKKPSKKPISSKSDRDKKAKEKGSDKKKEKEKEKEKGKTGNDMYLLVVHNIEYSTQHWYDGRLPISNTSNFRLVASGSNRGIVTFEWKLFLG